MRLSYCVALLMSGMAMVALPVASHAQTLICQPDKKFTCDAEEGCRPSALGTFYRVNASNAVYERCDRRGCDSYRAQVTRSGTMEIYELVGRGAFLKLQTLDNSFVESVSLTTVVILSFGSCRAG